MKAVSDATLLIHLSKIGCLPLLKKVFDSIIIPQRIFEEVINEGKKLKSSEIFSIEALIEEGFIIIKTPQSTIDINNLDLGEKECISLCKELNIDTILIDEKIGFNIALIFNLIPIRATSILIILLENRIIKVNRYKELLKSLLDGGYFLDAATYQKLLLIRENIAA